MAWIIRFLWITVVSTSVFAYDYNYFDQVQPHYRPQPRHTPAPYVPDHVPVRRSERKNTRMNERSIDINHGLQRVQEEEKRRVEPGTTRRAGNETFKIVNLSAFPKPQVTKRRGELNQAPSDTFVFPDQVMHRRSAFVLEIPEECKQKGYCLNVPNYPEAEVNQVINKLGLDKVKFAIEEQEFPEIAQRIGPADEMELCVSKKEIITPQAMRDLDGDWHILLNTKDSKFQSFHVELCRDEGRPCSDVAFFRTGYVSSCKQKKIIRTVATLDPNNNKVKEATVEFPSCCTCVVRHD